MIDDKNKNIENNDDKWEFSDYAFAITGIIVAVLLVLPEIVYSQFGISILGGSLSDVAPTIADGFEYGVRGWTIGELRALSPMLFLLTTTVAFFKDAYDARKTGGYKGSMFTHTFESLLEESIYMAITTIMVYGAIFTGNMYASWLAGPITWILFVFIFPLVRRKEKGNSHGEAEMPWLLLGIFAIGIVVEVVTGAWVAFPLSWLIICAIKLANEIRVGIKIIDDVFNVLYYAFSIVLMAAGILFDLWLTSWAAFPIALAICWVLHKLGYKKTSL